MGRSDVTECAVQGEPERRQLNFNPMQGKQLQFSWKPFSGRLLHLPQPQVRKAAAATSTSRMPFSSPVFSCLLPVAESPSRLPSSKGGFPLVAVLPPDWAQLGSSGRCSQTLAESVAIFRTKQVGLPVQLSATEADTWLVTRLLPSTHCLCDPSFM